VKKETVRSEKNEHVKFQDTEAKNNLFLLANSLKCIPKSERKSNGHIPELQDSLTSEENLLEDVEERVLARTRSQAVLMADSHHQLQRENLELKNEL